MTYRAKPADGVAWVTGASSGIGRETALELARRGYTVAVTARRLEPLEEMAAAAQAGPGRIIAHTGDVTDAARMEEVVETIERVHGPIALAFLNAGTYHAQAEKEFDAKAFRDTIDVNLGGALNSLAPLIKRMSERRKGQIAINASVAGYGGLPNAAAYGTSKAALIHMAESLKFTLDRVGVNLQVVNPGFVKTPLTDRNPFPMPFLMEVGDAVQRICDGFERGGFEITFPKRLAWILKAINLLPYPLYFALVGRATGESKGV